ncbi:methylaspartate mutase [Kitasatospora sp. NBC_01287]|uniref:methylaspartate mutase n=1 Tax=Kitasatospora sp. NBC_01287 TaxID=2903573 RepID=UPI0022549DE4|nr:methylaspartate mutase [Kitasatospora sp. NBC_01287]MCX4744346.1 methylaspartate mutase [Kitasatospora sp. NBC_01287]
MRPAEPHRALELAAERASGPAGTFHAVLDAARRRGALVVQPRMGFSDPARMRAGLSATKAANATTVGTLTLDSFTRVGDFAAVDRALRERGPLNGYPIVNFPTATTTAMLAGLRGRDFPVQVRHGSPLPGRIVDALIEAGLDATEGGPISYCLPYSRTPVQRSVLAWQEACQKLAALREGGIEPHLESFGGCMLGQLCPPSLLIAITVLEGLFFRRHGIRSISLSYAQQTNEEQDREAVLALHEIAAELLGDTSWHVVIYAYMGLYPETEHGALNLVADAARLAVRTGSTRLIVKTAAEAHRIPSIAENVTALEVAARAAAGTGRRPAPPVDTGIKAEARALIEAVLDLNEDIGKALVRAFAQGYLDVPYCLHPDNAGRARSVISEQGRLEWSRTGSLPIGHLAPARRATQLTSTRLLHALSYVKSRYDDADHATDHAADHATLRRSA